MKPEERYSRYLDATPKIDTSAFIAPGAVILGDVTIGRLSSVWFHCTLRADINKIVIGEGSNIQDNSVVHLADEHPVIIGNYVTVGHSAIVHACEIEDEVLVGMGAIIMDGAKIGHRSIIGAQALVTQNTVIPPGSLVLGSPAKVLKTLDDATQESIKSWADKYVLTSRRMLQK